MAIENSVAFMEEKLNSLDQVWTRSILALAELPKLMSRQYFGYQKLAAYLDVNEEIQNFIRVIFAAKF